MPLPEGRSKVLEEMMDRHGIQNVIEDLAEICYAKAQHVEEAWQDPGLASVWNSAGNYLWKVAYSKSIKRRHSRHMCLAKMGCLCY